MVGERGRRLSRWTRRQPVSVKIVGTRILDRDTFQLSELRPESLRRALERIATRDTTFAMTTATLTQDKVSGRLRWVIDGETPDRSALTYEASTVGSEIERCTVRRAVEEQRAERRPLRRPSTTMAR